MSFKDKVIIIPDMYVIQANNVTLIARTVSCFFLSLWAHNGITEAKNSLLQKRFNSLKLNASHGAAIQQSCHSNTQDVFNNQSQHMPIAVKLSGSKHTVE